MDANGAHAKKQKHGCGLATKSTGQKEVIVAGGDSPSIGSVEILNLDSGSWRWAKKKEALDVDTVLSAQNSSAKIKMNKINV